MASALLLVGTFFAYRGCIPAQQPNTQGNMVVNADFELQHQNFPVGWQVDNKIKSKGQIDMAKGPARGQLSLRMRPNKKNTNDIMALNIAQGYAADAVRGKTLKVSAWLAGGGGATAVFGVHIIDRTGGMLANARLTSKGDKLEFQEATLDVPDSSSAVLMVILCQAAGQGGETYFDDVSVRLTTAAAAAPKPLPPSGGATQATIRVDATQQIRRIPRTIFGSNLQWHYGGNMIYDFRTNALNPELIRMTRDLGVSLLRFPGGHFADFYHWRDGIGPQSQRKETPPQTGDAKQRHFFGTDEALEFAGKADARLLMIVNAHTGTPAEAAEWVRYVNTSPERRVDYWQIGNEFYIKNDHPANAAIPPGEYVKRLRQYAPALRAADPNLKLIAVGGENFGKYNSNHYPGWNQEVLSKAADTFDLFAVHNGYFPALLERDNYDARTVYQAMLAAPVLMARNLDTLARQIDQFAGSRAPRIELAVTEWGPFFHLDIRNRWMDHTRTLGSALFVASVLKAFVEQPKLTVANAFQLIDLNFAGWMGPKSETHLTDTPGDNQWAPKAPYFAFQMFTKHFGPVLVRSTTESPTYDTPEVGMVGAVSGVPYLETVSSRSDDGQTLYVLVINKHLDSEIRGKVSLSGFQPQGGTAWMLTGSAIDANTGTKLVRGVQWGKQVELARMNKGGPGEVTLRSQPVNVAAAEFEYAFPKHSVTCLELRGSPVGARSTAVGERGQGRGRRR
ncbi:MAG TPA: hypothetical protein DEH78_21015 [Solibacterales bacterium]|nr:hypothetical protein [Bryobacterales bacterium]